MSRRITAALLGLVAAAVVLAGLGGVALARRADQRENEANLLREVTGLAALVDDRALARRTAPVRRAILDAFELSGFDVVPLAGSGSGSGLDPGVVADVAAGRSVTYRDGGELVAVVPSAGGRSAVVGTRTISRGLGPAGPWVLLSSGVVLVVAVLVAAGLSRRLTAPLAATRAVAARIADGDLSARVGHLGDDELGELGRSIDAMAASLERARGLQRSFLLAVSHDLRTPLTAIRGFGELLADDDDPERARMGARIDSEARRLQRLVTDLLDLATLDAQRPSLHPVELDVAGVVRAAVDSLRPAAAAAGLELFVDAPPATVAAVADPDRLGQIVTNLVENAIGFAAGTVVVSVSGPTPGSAPRPGPPAGQAAVEIVVADDGPGIAPDVVPHVFERLRTTRPRTRSGGPGSGLGLAIVAELVEAMGGRVDASCPPAGGARFAVTLPAPPAPPVPG